MMNIMNTCYHVNIRGMSKMDNEKTNWALILHARLQNRLKSSTELPYSMNSIILSI